MDDAFRQRVVRVLADVFGVAAAALPPEASPATVASWDSLRHLNMVIALEEEFGVMFAADEVEQAVSVEAVCRLVASKAA